MKIVTSGHLHSYEETQKACDIIEKLFGKDFFKKGVGIIKDSDPSGSGMGRHYTKNSTSRLLLAWYKAREELTYSAIQGFFRPGIYSAVIGALGKDLLKLGGIPGVETTAAGLLDDNCFDRTIFMLSIASGFKSITDQVFFPHEPKGYFSIGGGYDIHCISLDIPGSLRGNLHQQYVCQRIKEFITNKSNSGGKKILYYEITSSGYPLESAGRLTENNPTLLTEQGITAIILCKTEFPLSTGGVYKKISAYPVINKETSGFETTEGLNLYIP